MRSTSSLPVRVLTHNIRYATRSPFKGEEAWDLRRPKLLNELHFNTRHCPEAFICLQEVLHNQLQDIHHNLNLATEQWAYVGVGREDGKEAGEYSPIFYRPGIWQLNRWKTVWLSETPDRPSRGWDAASTRILTIAHFRHRETHKLVVAMTTHLDDQGHVSRLESAKLIQEQIRHHTDQGPHRPLLPVFLAGDFNSEPHQEAYLWMTRSGSPMADIQGLVANSELYGDLHTFTGFNPETTRQTRIDFIFVSKQERQEPNNEALDLGRDSIDILDRWRVEGYAVLPNRFEDEVFSSDHRAVVGDLRLFE